MQFGTSGALDRKGKHIPDASLGLDEAGSAGIGLQLAPQPQNVHIDATVEDILVRAGRLQQVFAREWALRRVEESDQQGIFTFSSAQPPRHWGRQAVERAYRAASRQTGSSRAVDPAAADPNRAFFRRPLARARAPVVS